MGRHSRGGASTPPPEPEPPASRSVEDTGVWDRSTYRIVDVGLPAEPVRPAGSPVSFPLGGSVPTPAPPAPGRRRAGATRTSSADRTPRADLPPGADRAGPPSRAGAAGAAGAPSPRSAFDPYAPRAGAAPRSPAADASLRGPAADSGLRGSAADSGLRGPAADFGLRGPAVESGLRGPGADSGLRRPAAESGLGDPGLDSGLRGSGAESGFGSSADRSWSETGSRPTADRYGRPGYDRPDAGRTPFDRSDSGLRPLGGTATGYDRPDTGADLRPLGGPAGYDRADTGSGLRPLASPSTGYGPSDAGLRPLGDTATDHDRTDTSDRYGRADAGAPPVAADPFGLGRQPLEPPADPGPRQLGSRVDTGSGLPPLGARGDNGLRPLNSYGDPGLRRSESLVDSGPRPLGSTGDGRLGLHPLGTADGGRRYGATRADLVGADTDGATALQPSAAPEPDEVTDTGARRTRSTFRLAEEPDDEPADESSLLVQWAVFVAQTLTGAAVGLGVWLGFYRLWSTWPLYAAPGVGVTAIVLLVTARALRRRHGRDLDLLTAIVTFAVTTVLTVLPAAFALQSLA